MDYLKLNMGLDRCRFVLCDIAVDRSVFRMNIEAGEKAEILDVATGEMVGVSDFNLSIKGVAKNDKDNYKIKLNLMKNPTVNFVLDVNIPKLFSGSNEKNINDLSQLAQVNEIIEKSLAGVGVLVDMNKAKISSVEMNVNSNDRKLYDTMKIIRKGFNTTNEKVFLVESKNKIESLMIRSGHMKIKVYDKAQQLKDTEQFGENENLVRVEVSTNKPESINAMTNNNPTMDGVVENWDKLEKWFKEMLLKHVKKPCDRFNEMVENGMVEQLKGGHKTYDILALQAQRGNLVDIELFSRAMKRYYKEVGKKSPSSIIKNTKSRYEKLDKNQYESISGNIEALEKLWKQVGL